MPGSPFWPTFFGETKRWVAAGLPPASNLKIRAQGFENQIRKQFESEINMHNSMVRTPLERQPGGFQLTPCWNDVNMHTVHYGATQLTSVQILPSNAHHYADFVKTPSTKHQDPIPALYYPPPHP